MYEKKWHVALYVLFRQILSLQHKDRALPRADMLSVLPPLEKYLENLHRRGKIVTPETICELGMLPELNHGALFGISVQEVSQCFLSLAGKIQDLFIQFLSAIGFNPSADTKSTITDTVYTCRKYLPLQVYQNFLRSYPKDADYLVRLSYNRSLYGIAQTRHHGLAHAMLSVMLLKRAIHTPMDTIDQENSVVFLNPVYQGYSIYTVATPLLSNYMPFLLWDRASEEIIYIETCISAYLPTDIRTFSYSVLSPKMDIGCGKLSFASIREGAYFPEGRFRHYYVSRQITDSDPLTCLFCIEDLDADAGAYCRAYLFLRYYRSPENLHLILLVDSPDSALTFYQDIVWGKRLGGFSQSPGCKVPLYAKDSYQGRCLSWRMPQLLFLERGNSLYAETRLFGISENGCIVYYR